MTSSKIVLRRFRAAIRLPRASILSWPAWLRMLAVLPAVALLWLLVLWASVEVLL